MTNTEALQVVLDGIRAVAQTERDKGTAFERLVKTYLLEDALWAEKFSDVWMWSDWPDRGGRGDAGIDLVAREGETGDLWAIQAKFYDPSYALQKGDIDSFFTESGKAPFASRMIVSTTDHWSSKAEEALDGQQIPVTRLRLMDLADSTIDWATYKADQAAAVQHMPARILRPHQDEALRAVESGFTSSDRGKLIMACGTGKTFTALRIAEQTAGEGGRVLFLVPSISLLQQTLREWTNHSLIPLRSFAVCSDSKIGKKQEDISVHDLQYPATTNAGRLAQHASAPSAEKLTVVFATYQSIQVVAEAQSLGLGDFNLIICDEAHRTTGVTLAEADESNFVRVHDANFIKGARRLYMTATPRLYSDEAKSKADEAGAVIASMDDEAVFGPEFHRLGFGEAVERDLLSDYKVLVLAVDESFVAKAFQQQLADENHELRLDDAAKIIGCWNGLAKRRVLQVGEDGTALEDPENAEDPAPMRRAVAFAKSIKDSKRLTDMFGGIVADYTAASDDPYLLQCQTKHVDGTFNVLDRNERLDWLKAQTPENTCRILSNARCLSEGVDVPALDAVLFLNPRNSTVDVVQSVGRVMRKHPDKKYGYVILPIGIPAGMTPEEALADHQRYKVVWQVLQALRAHDDRFNAMVNKIDLNSGATDQIQIIGVGGGVDDETGEGPENVASAIQGVLPFPQIDQWRDAILAKLVQKVGDRRYWEDWALDIAQIAERHVTRIKAILDAPESDMDAQFESFLTGLRGNLNDSITRDEAIEMLAQHLITRPVFDALFEGYSFAAANPVSRVMQEMLDALDKHSLNKESETLDKFYESVRMRASGIDNAEGKQRIIVDLYETFFKRAFPQMADKLGIVYTPVEIVDFILRSVQGALQQQFGSSLSDEGVHILDPFAGTGTFIVRLLQSGLVSQDALERKYRRELHANEIVLLAYYIAAINIEATFHAMHGGSYEPFDGIVLTDTFQMYEDGDTLDDRIFVANNDRIQRQMKAPIRVIIGNPPYRGLASSGQSDDANLPYPTLDERISTTYGHLSQATTRTSVYDSYIRAFRWATDRVGDEGVVAFVTNNGWLTSKTGDGLRLSLERDFDAIYVLDLLGNSRTGRDAAAEGGNVFGVRVGISVFIGIKRTGSDKCRIHYASIGENLGSKEKLEKIDQLVFEHVAWEDITPNAQGDWTQQRSEEFEQFIPLGGRAERQDGLDTLFVAESAGLMTNRDPWVYSYSRETLTERISRVVALYDQVRSSGDFAAPASLADVARFPWNQGDKSRLAGGKQMAFDASAIRVASYRPFNRQYVYFRREMVHSVYKLDKFFPAASSRNQGIFVSGPGGSGDFAALAIEDVPDRHLLSTGQFYPRWQPDADGLGDQPDLWSSASSESTLTSNLSERTVDRFRKALGEEVSHDDVFAYIYAMLNAQEYRERFANSLTKTLPRVPISRNFRQFAEVGSVLLDLHLNYESAEPYPLIETWRDPAKKVQNYRVDKMRFPGTGVAKDRSVIVYNADLTISGIPLEAHLYRLGGRSALEWVVDRYQRKTDKTSGIVNDPNDWGSSPTYIVDLLRSLTTVSLRTVDLLGGLPSIDEIPSQQTT